MNQIPKELQHLVDTLRGFDPNRLTDDVIKDGEAWADNDAAATSLEETKKTLLAKIAIENMESGHKSGGVGEKPRVMSVAQAELKALADERFEVHLELMVQARKEANRARVRYDLGKMRLELMRSLQATLRNEMRLSGNTT